MVTTSSLSILFAYQDCLNLWNPDEMFDYLSPLLTARKTLRLVNTDQFAAFGTRPLFFFFLHKAPDADLTDSVQVLNRAHPVLRPVAFVHVRDAFAGKVVAVEAIFEAVCQKLFTSLDFADDAGFRFEAIVSPAARTSVFVPHIRIAEAAVHSARGNQVRANCAGDFLLFLDHRVQCGFAS